MSAPEPTRSNPPSGGLERKRLTLILVWMTAIAIALPVLCGWTPSAPATGAGLKVRTAAGYAAGLGICAAIYFAECRRRSRSLAFAAAFLIFLLTSVLNNVHKFSVDNAQNYFPVRNDVWQAKHHALVAELSTLPLMPPHSARFLPDSFVRWLELGGLSYEAGRDVYRFIFVLLLFYALFYYACLYTTYAGAILTIVLAGMIYPVSFQHYAGQLTDPMSHLSFVLALIFLQRGDFPLLLSTVAIGSVAKESVLVMAGYYVLFCRHDRQYALKAIGLAAAAVASYFGVRWYVLHRAMQYEDVSGVSLAHVVKNWQAMDVWLTPLLLTAGALMPFLVLSWKSTPLPLKRAVLYLLPLLFTSSLFFSWLAESRNFMPAVFPLAVIAAHYLVRCSANDAGALVSASRGVDKRQESA